MPRLIDANALMDAFHSYMAERYDRERCVSEENCKTCAGSCLWRKIVSAAPTVDAVEVVRCKDCKHWKFIDSLNPHWECQIFCGLHDCGYLTGADDFCSYGERRNDEA